MIPAKTNTKKTVPAKTNTKKTVPEKKPAQEETPQEETGVKEKAAQAKSGAKSKAAQAKAKAAQAKEKAAQAKASKAIRSGGDGKVDKENAVFFMLSNPEKSRGEVVKAMMETPSKRSEGGWNTMVGALDLALKHLDGKGSEKGAFYAAAIGIAQEINDLSELKKFVSEMEGKPASMVSGSVQYVYYAYLAKCKFEAENK